MSYLSVTFTHAGKPSFLLTHLFMLITYSTLWSVFWPSNRAIYGDIAEIYRQSPYNVKSLRTYIKKDREIMESQDLIMDGDLQTLGLQSILKMLALSGKTGTLLIQSGRETLSISLRKGQIVALREEGPIQPDLLGMLCLINKLDPPRAHAVREVAQGDMHLSLAMLVERNWMSTA